MAGCFRVSKTGYEEIWGCAPATRARFRVARYTGAIMDEATREALEKLAVMVAAGFSEMRDELGEMRQELSEVRAVVDKNTYEINYLDRKLDNRFDLLERMMFDNLGHDRNRLGTLEASVKRLTEHTA